MVVTEPTQEQVDLLFHALADATRRDILRRCTTGESSVTRLAKAYPMSFAAVQKHVAVLERSGLVQTRKAGRSRTCTLVGSRLAEAEAWLAEQRALWEARSDRLVEFVERRHQEEQDVSQPRRPR